MHNFTHATAMDTAKIPFGHLQTFPFRLNMTEKLFTGTLNHNQKKKKTFPYSGLEIIFGTYSSRGASGLIFSLVLTPVAIVL